MTQLLSDTERWEQAWADYMLALDTQDAEPCGDDFAIWCGLTARRMRDAQARLRQIDRAFCDRLGI